MSEKPNHDGVRAALDRAIGAAPKADALVIEDLRDALFAPCPECAGNVWIKLAPQSWYGVQHLDTMCEECEHTGVWALAKVSDA